VNTLDSRIANIDQLLAQDVEKFRTGVADLYSNICKVTPFPPLPFSLSPLLLVAYLGYYYLCSKTDRSDRCQRSITLGVLSRLFGLRPDTVRSVADPFIQQEIDAFVDYVVRLVV
jgi:hypothetical protein